MFRNAESFQAFSSVILGPDSLSPWWSGAVAILWVLLWKYITIHLRTEIETLCFKGTFNLSDKIPEKKPKPDQ